MITTKQRAKLRGLANDIEPILQIGKGGITENTLKQADEALTARELIKGTCLETCPITAREALEQICDALDAEPVSQLGRRFVLYRRNEKKPTIQV